MNEEKIVTETTKKRERHSRKTSQPLPDPRMAVEKQVQILKAICAASNKGEKFVTSSEVAPLAGVHETQAGGVCSFFYRINLLERDNYMYKPKQIMVEFCNELEWSPETAGNILQKGFTDSWFEKIISGYFSVNKEATKEELIKNLGRVAQADQFHHRAISILVDFLEFANIVEIDETSKKYKLKNTVKNIPSEIKNSVSEKSFTQEQKQKEGAVIINNQGVIPQVNTIMHVNVDVKFDVDTDPETLAKKVNRFKELIK